MILSSIPTFKYITYTSTMRHKSVLTERSIIVRKRNAADVRPNIMGNMNALLGAFLWRFSAWLDSTKPNLGKVRQDKFSRSH